MSKQAIESMPGPYKTENYCVTESIGYLIGSVRSSLHCGIDARAQVFDITAAQWKVMIHVFNGLTTAAELCRFLLCDTGSMTRMLDRLEEKSLIRRERSQEDRRVVYIAPTKSALALYPQLQQIGMDVLNEHLRSFSADELTQFQCFLRRMVDNAG